MVIVPEKVNHLRTKKRIKPGKDFLTLLDGEFIENIGCVIRIKLIDNFS